MVKNLLAFLLLPGVCHASSTMRGTWFWGASGDPYGSTAVVGNALKEAEVRANFSANGISYVYGSYGNRPILELSTIAAWNGSLNTLGMTSELLLSENSWLDPANYGSFTDKIQDRLLTFNGTVAASDAFKGLHLDIEPQATAAWSGLDGPEKKMELDKLLAVYNVARNYLNDHGGATITLSADLPVWFDSSGSITWGAGERDSWFASVSSVLDSVSLMPFDRDTFSSIQSGVEWEIANMTTAVRVGVEVDIPGTWDDMAEFWSIADAIEAEYGEAAGIDIQSYAKFAAETVPEPSVPMLAWMMALSALVRRKRQVF